MPNSNEPSQQSLGELPDKDHLYGQFTKWFERQLKFTDKVKHMALDVPMDDDPMNNVGNRYRFGLGWKELAVAGAIGLGSWHLATRQPEPVDPPAVTAPPEDRDTTRGIGIRKYVPPAKPGGSSE